ncbi:MAG: metallophosphoesterase [Oscillospiraceae bacterium]|nr:metallophosphoesterase [Oscillospiraceae bacterium]
MRRSKLAFALSAVTIPTALAYFLYENNRLTVSDYIFESEKVPESFDGFRIAHISDLHNKSFGKNNKRLFELIAFESPDIIVISGDLVDSRHTDKEVALDFLRVASEIAPTFYTTGNHEDRFPEDEMAEFLRAAEKAGATVLTHDRVTLSIGNDKIYLCGIADKLRSCENLKSLMSGTGDAFTILISHRPQFGRLYGRCGADLTFSGHAHGGQMRLGCLSVISPDQGFFPKYTSGIHHFGKSATVISRGLGNSLIPVRINNPPELVLCKIKCKKAPLLRGAGSRQAD